MSANLQVTLVDVDLEERYGPSGRPAIMSGVQALVRLLLEQRRLDDARGLRTGVFVSGYPGSPLGGLDREITRARKVLEPAGVVFTPGVNEELAATAVAGTQLVPELPGRRLDGVTGFWYGKGPGLDRAADAIRHGNVSGTTHLGGAVVLLGEDPTCKSSTLPSSCELMAESLSLPLFSPSTVADVVRLGLHAVAMSREAGLWTALKIISDVADSTAATLTEDFHDEVPEPPAESRGPAPTLLGASSVAAEHDLLGARVARAREYGRRHRLNRIVFEPTVARTAIVAPGPSFAAVQHALELLGLEAGDLDRLGVRLVRLDLVWPLHPEDVAGFVDGVEQVIVVEDKRPFVERQLRDLLYGTSSVPAILGKHDAAGRSFIPLAGSVDADAVMRALAGFWDGALPEPSAQRVAAARARVRASSVALPVVRTPFFCSGCPHNLSTRAPEDQLVGAGIGCHSLIAVDPAAERGHLLGAPQMGGEGAQWIGMAPFTDDRGYRQNLGDGTFHHSGSLAIRAAVAAGVSITYRLLYNDAIAMTGGQSAPGRLSVADVAGELLLEGVRRVVITTEDPESFRDAGIPTAVEVRHRDQLEAVQQELAQVDGVTVVIHADRCATEERRLRKRGKLPTPAERVWINERVCEGCGDCGSKSSCLSVVPVATELGRKTQIHQASCTQDLACLAGDCPSFVVIEPGKKAVARPEVPDVPFDLPDPTPRFDADDGMLVRMPGIGGTGVVTVSQILQVAAMLDGRSALGLDQTGLAQKGGAVISDVRILPRVSTKSVRAASGEVDVLLGLDIVGTATPETLRTLDRERTIAVANLSGTPTAAMVVDADAPALPIKEIVARVEASTRGDQALWLDAGMMADRLFGDHMPANVIMLGAAYQHGCLPVSGDAIERAIEMNGTGVAANLAAFRWGRAAVVDRLGVETALAAHRPSLCEELPVSAAAERMVAAAGLTGDLAEVAAKRATDLIAYQHARLARRYVDEIRQVAEAEHRVLGPSSDRIAQAHARGLHKLMAYKDEYEVARLHLDTVEQAKRRATFGDDAKVSVLLHPPLLRAMGVERKLRFKRSAVPMFRVLRAARRLRGTPLDIFGRAEVRRTERALIDEHRQLVSAALEALTPQNADAVLAIAELSGLIRGYEDIKLANVERYRQEARRQLERLRPPAA